MADTADDLVAQWRIHGSWPHVRSEDFGTLVDEIERLRTKLAGHDDGLDRWCNYQDRLVEVLDRLELRKTVLAELKRDGWRNPPECAHKQRTLDALIENGRAVVDTDPEHYAVVVDPADPYVKYVYGDYEGEGPRPPHGYRLVAVEPEVLDA